jgi:hypothetical protein
VEGFLPPQAPGPEPELGQRPDQAPPPPTAPYAPQPVEADNGPAVTGFVLSVVGGGLLVVSGGISSIVSLILSIFGIVYSRRGTARIHAGVTTRSAGLAQAGFIIGIVALVLSALATIAWIAVLVLVLTDDEFRRDFEDEFDSGNSIAAVARVAAVTGRTLLA